MERHPLVSIVTPSYNQGRYIEAAIQSVLAQDYPNLEYIVVDGGSSDETLSILKRHEGQFVWLSGRDRGQADAINKGLQIAKGDILGWLNSDDTYLPGAIRKVVKYFEAHPDIGMVYGEGFHVDEGGSVIERYSTEAFDYQRLREVCFICQPAAFFRAAVFRAIGPLDSTLRYCLDYDYWIRVSERFKIGYVSEDLATSRLHIDSKTLSRRIEVHEEILRTVSRYYPKVPASWIYAYARVCLADKLMPNIYGIYADGWASRRVRLFVRGERSQCAHLSLRGTSPAYTCPQRLRIAVGDRVVHEAMLEGGEFAVTQQIRLSDVAANASDTVEVSISAHNSFTPQRPGINDDGRCLSYRVRKLSLVDELGRELILYSDRKARLLVLGSVALFLWKFLLINRSIPYREIRRNIAKLWAYLRRPAWG